MSEKKYKYAVYMGRFQPFHDGHAKVAERGFEIAEKLIIMVGGVDKARQAKNPFTFLERVHMIVRSVAYADTDRLIVLGMHDHPYSNTAWAREVKTKIYLATKEDPGSIALIGHHKDASSFYLDMFPEWGYEEVENYNNIDATSIRNLYFNSTELNIPDTGISAAVKGFLKTFQGTDHYTSLAAEHKYICEHRKAWQTPFPSVFSTVDIAVIKDGELMIIMRGGMPGKGLRALPGGYIDAKETLLTSARRELKEETGLYLTESEFLCRLVCEPKVFDHPDRSQIGRVITHLYVLNMDGVEFMPEAGDDAAVVGFIPLSSLDSLRSTFSGDHWYMCKYAARMYETQISIREANYVRNRRLVEQY